MVRVLVFGGIRDIVGRDSVEIDIGAGGTTVSLLNALVAAHPKIDQWRPFLRVAVNREYTTESVALSPADEIAIIPPVSGG